MSDPNFPPNLNIHPLHIAPSRHPPATTDVGPDTDADADTHRQKEAIAKYGIAGRVWEAGKPLLEYLNPNPSSPFDPPCPFFNQPGPFRILELGSGQALPSLHLASNLSPSDTIVLTDLPNVVPLCEQSVQIWRTEREATADSSSRGKEGAEVKVRPLAWGEQVHEVLKLGPYTHILMCDLVYFPHLYPPLLRTLLEVTEPGSLPSTDTETFGPEIILSYKTRSMALEQSFFDAFGQYFRLTPVTGGSWDEARVYVCQRWRVTEEWKVPSVAQVMGGVRGVVRGRAFDHADEMYAALEWD